MKGDTIIVEGEGMPRRGTTRLGNLNVSISLEIKPEEKASLVKNKELVASLFT
jgi:DnaJ-class molecular chaperone